MNRIRYILLIGAIIVLTIQLFIADYADFWKWGTILNIILPILLISTMVLSIRSANNAK